jgi:hypothetical protein
MKTDAWRMGRLFDDTTQSHHLLYISGRTIAQLNHGHRLATALKKAMRGILLELANNALLGSILLELLRQVQDWPSACALAPQYEPQGGRNGFPLTFLEVSCKVGHE